LEWAGARFPLYSATKPLLASVVWQLIGEDALDPARPVATWWPGFARHGKSTVTLEQVMVHTAGLPNAPLTLEAGADRALRVSQMEDWVLEWEPGTQYAYHGLSGHWIMAELVERITGTDYRSALRQRVLDPLGLDRVQLGAPEADQGDISPMVRVGAPPSPEAIVELLGVPLSVLTALPSLPAGAEDVLETLRRPDVIAAGWPGGGGVSDAASYALFYQHLLHDPKGLWDPRVLHDAKTHVRNLLPDFLGRAAYRTLGLETSGDDDKRDKRIGYGATSPGTFGHAGAGGQVAWADPAIGLSFVFLTSSIDADFVRMYRREATVTRLAAACAAELS
jgi:CubicO group peptidase (beta-lactamase class C family)